MFALQLEAPFFRLCGELATTPKAHLKKPKKSLSDIA
jgi:hypothetical protein